MTDGQRTNLITGAASVAGLHLAVALMRRGERVRGLVCDGFDRERAAEVFAHYGVEDSVEWFAGDVLDEEVLRRAMQGVDVVYNAETVESYASCDRAPMWRTNVEGTALVARVAAECGACMCHVGSVEAAGRAERGQSDESTPWVSDDRRSTYARSCFRQEMEVWRAMEEGLRAVVVEAGKAIGPGCEETLFASRWLLPGRTTMVDARDLAETAIALVDREKWGQKYIVVGHSLATSDLQRLTARARGTKEPVSKAGKWRLLLFSGLSWEQVRSMFDSASHEGFSSAKVMSELGTTFRTTDDTLQNLASFYQRKK